MTEYPAWSIDTNDIENINKAQYKENRQDILNAWQKDTPHMSGKNGNFICFARGMIFEGHVLTYIPSTNEAEWILVHGTTSDLLCTEEVSTLVLCNLVLCIPDEGASRLDRFREHRDAEGGVGEASSTEVSCEEGPGEESMHEDKPEDADDEDTDDMSMSSSVSSQESQCSTHCYSDRHHHPHSWAEQCESEDEEDDSLVGLPTSQCSGGKGEGEVGHSQAPTSVLLGVQESSSELTEAAPGEMASTTCDVLSTGSQDVMVIYTTEDELKSLD